MTTARALCGRRGVRDAAPVAGGLLGGPRAWRNPVRHTILGVVLRGGIRQWETDHFPAAGDGQTIGVHGTQVVRVWFGVRGQWTEDGGGIRVDEGESGHRRPLAG